MTDLVLHIGNKNYSSWSLRPWLAMRVAGVPFREELHQIEGDAPRAEIRALSPGGRVPFLQAGDLVVWDSLAIIEYVAETFRHGRLWPADSAARAVARSLCAEMHAGFQPLRSAMPMNIRRRYARRERSAEVDADIARLTVAFRDTRAAFGAGGPFLFGRFTAADAFFAPVVTRLRTYAVPLDGEAAAYCEAILAVPALQEWSEAAALEPETIAKYEFSE